MSKAQERQNAILSSLRYVQISTAQSLAEEFNVSTETIRTDLKVLSQENKVVLTHGGVMLPADSDDYFPFDLRRKKNYASKSQIGKVASCLVEKGDAILLENSTTSLALIEALLKQKDLLETLTIVTNSFSIAALIEPSHLFKQFFFFGGWVDFTQHATTGSAMIEGLSQLYIDKAFLSAAALSRDGVITSYYENDRVFQRTALKQAKETILMVGKEKYGKEALIRVTDLSSFSKIVTDADLTEEEKQQIKNKVGDSNLIMV